MSLIHTLLLALRHKSDPQRRREYIFASFSVGMRLSLMSYATLLVSDISDGYSKSCHQMLTQSARQM